MEKKNTFYAFRIVTFLIFFFLFLFLLLLRAPADFPAGVIFRIEEGASLRGVSKKLKDDHIIRSRLAFEALVILFGKERNVIRADYYFENKLPVWEIASRIRKGEHHLAPIVVVIPEGFDTVEIANTFDVKLPNFD